MNRQEQEQLLADFIQGTASDLQVAELQQLLKSHPELKQSLAEMLLIEQMLYVKHDDKHGELLKNEVLHALDDDSSGRHFTKETIDQIRSRQQKSNRKATRSHRRKRPAKKQDPLWIGLGVAAAILFIIIAAWPSPAPAPSPKESPVVKKEIKPEAPKQIGQWQQLISNNLKHPQHADQRSTRCYIGDQLKASQDTILVLDDASEIHISTGTHIEIRGDTQNSEIYLHSGSIKAQITKQKTGSAILFPTSFGTSRIVGTAFSLNSNIEGSRLEVYSGRIEQTHEERKESVFVDAGHYVDIVPNKSLEVKPIAVAVKKIEPPPAIIAEPEPVIIAEAPVIEKPFYEWSTKNAKAWFRGSVSSEGINSHEDFEGHVIYARLPRSERELLLANDEFHFTLRANDQYAIYIDVFLADQNNKSPSHLQFATFTVNLDQNNQWQPVSFRLGDLTFPHKKFIEVNHGCFAIRLRTARSQAFALQRALIKRNLEDK